MCIDAQAHAKGMMHPDYVWMVHNWYNIDWWMNDKNCTQDQKRTVLTSQIVLDHFPRINEEDKNRMNDGGVVSKQLYALGFKLPI